MGSQAEEDRILAKLLWLHGVREPGNFVEIGVGTGVENNTVALAERGWRGVWLGDEPLVWYPTTVHFVQATVTPENVKDLLQRAPIRVDVFSLDIDGNDYWVGKVVIPLLMPRIVIVEYYAPAGGTHWVMPYTPNYRWHQGQPCGASLDAWRALLEPLGYSLVYTTFRQVNAFFVRTGAIMRNALEEALQVLEDLRERVNSNEGRPSAEEICGAITHALALVGEYQAQQQITHEAVPEPLASPGERGEFPLSYTPVAEVEEILPEPPPEYGMEPDTTAAVLPSAPDDVRRSDSDADGS